MVAFGAAMGVLGLLWQFHSYQVLAVGVLALAGIAIWSVQWIEAKRGSPTPDRIGVVVAAVALAALLQWSLKAGLEAARVVKFPGQWELVIAIGLPLTLFLMA